MRVIIYKGLSNASRILLISATVVSFFATAEAARLTVRVNNSSNAPVSGANACYINNTIVQSKSTNSQGDAVFDNVPQGALKVIASKNGFLGVEREINMSSADKTEILVLQVGAGGNTCDGVTPPPSSTAVLTVQVSRQNGTALADAVVCISLGTSGSARATDNQGRAVFEGQGPPLPFTFRLVVLKQGFQHVDQQFTMNSPSQQQSVTLLEGSSTPPSNISCALLGSVGGQTTLPSISITNFKVNGGGLPTTTNRIVILTATFSRTPGFYRVGETNDLSNRPWLPFNPNAPTAYQLNLLDVRGVNFGVRQVYFQVAPTATNASVSNLSVAPVILAPTQISTRILTGTALLQFISRAQEAGYRFSLSQTDRRIFEGSRQVTFDDGCAPGVRELTANIVGSRLYVEDHDFKVFQGPPLNAFWKILNIQITAPTGRENSTNEVTGISGGLIQGLQQVPLRVVAIRSHIKVFPSTRLGDGRPICTNNISPFRISLQTPSLTSITVEGPSDMDSRNALPPPN